MYVLYSLGTPNGIKPTIMLEELKAKYELKLIDINKGEQFAPEFLAISPNNKIPVLYDKGEEFYLFESVAILQYLAEKHGAFFATDVKERYSILKWCYFQVAHIGPMFGQLGHFTRYAPEPIPYAIKRYTDETNRLMGVMDKQLSEFAYISGDEYSIADMAIWPWMFTFQTFYQQHLDEERFPSLTRWYKKIASRPAIKAALKKYDLII